MDFENLPTKFFVNILRYLRLEDQIRVCRVNQKFQEIALVVIPETKSIRLSTEKENPFYRLDIDSLSKILQLCAVNLREIEINGNAAAWVEVFAQFSYPQLIKLNVETNTDIINNFFSPIIASSNKLKNLKWRDWTSLDSNLNDDYPYLIFPNNIDYEQLETIEMWGANDDTFRSITGRCRNLKELKIVTRDDRDYELSDELRIKMTTAISDDFFAGCPNLEICHILNDDSTTAIQYSELIHFWSLHSMRDLLLQRPSWIPFDDGELIKISASFPRLETLHLRHMKNLTNNGIASLLALKNLRGLFLFSTYDGGIGSDLDIGIQQLIDGCDQLQMVEMIVKITSATLITLVQNCRNLRSLYVTDVIGVQTKEDAVVVVKSCAGIGNRNREISIHTGYAREVWKSNEVRAALETLTVDGYMIDIQ